MKKLFYFFSAIVFCLFVRLIPFRAPNVEPVLSLQMPFSSSYGSIVAFSFAFLSIFIFDIVTSKVGTWTILVALVYGALGIISAWYFKKNPPTRRNFLFFSVFGTIFFDAATGLTIGPILFNQSFDAALIGQIPFTIYHLLGNMSFAYFLSPIIYKFISTERGWALLSPKVLLAKHN